MMDFWISAEIRTVIERFGPFWTMTLGFAVPTGV
jgi:hypothetical protein